VVGERLDVDVGGPHRNRFLDDQVDEPDDRRVPFLQCVRARTGLGAAGVLGEVDRRVGEFLKHRVDRLGLGR
jgi:hypothetical protein